MNKLTNAQLTQELAECKLENKRINHDLMETKRALKDQQILEEKVELYERTLGRAKVAVDALTCAHYPNSDPMGIIIPDKAKVEWQENAFRYVAEVLRESEQLKRVW